MPPSATPGFVDSHYLMAEGWWDRVQWGRTTLPPTPLPSFLVNRFARLPHACAGREPARGSPRGGSRAHAVFSEHWHVHQSDLLDRGGAGGWFCGEQGVQTARGRPDAGDPAGGGRRGGGGVYFYDVERW